MYLSKAIAARPILLKSKTVPAGTEIYPIEALCNTAQEILRGSLAEVEPVVADGNLWAAGPEDVALFFQGANHELVPDLAKLLLKFELDNPNALTILGGRSDMLKAIKLEALKRRDFNYHKEN